MKIQNFMQIFKCISFHDLDNDNDKKNLSILHSPADCFSQHTTGKGYSSISRADKASETTIPNGNGKM